MPDFQRIFANHYPQPGYCLVLRPFNDASDQAWGTIKQRLEQTFRWTDIKDLRASGTVMDQILTEIARTDVVIVDITGSNPNVFFELGIARTAKPGRKVLIVKRDGDEDDRPAAHPSNERVIPFDISPDRYLSFATTDEGIQAMLPELERRLWDALERSQWFQIGEGEVFSVGPLERADGPGAVMVDVQPTEFLERQFGPNAGKVHVEITFRSRAAHGEFHRDAAADESITCSLGFGETAALRTLPWRLKFHWFEGDKARFCVESVEKQVGSGPS